MVRVTFTSHQAGVYTRRACALALMVLVLAGCAGGGGPPQRRLEDAVRVCDKTHQRAMLIDPSTQASAGGYTNIQDSSGQRQTTQSDPSGGPAGWFKCVP